MTSFSYELIKKLHESYFNNYTDNYCEFRYGPKTENMEEQLEAVHASKGFLHKSFIDKIQSRLEQGYKNLLPALDYVYRLMQDDASRQLMVDVTAYRLLGHTKVKLLDEQVLFPREQAEQLQACIVPNDELQTGFALCATLKKYDLSPMGKNIRLYYSWQGFAMNFFYQQYSYTGDQTIKAEKGDYVIDAGACWGDTSVFFASQVGATGKVFSFEFIPTNIGIFKKNVALNPELQTIIQLEPSPVWSTSNQPLFYKDNGPGSAVSLHNNAKYKDSVNTVAIDDFVERENIEKIDFIKMDIEGAELEALKGAEKILRKFKPKLAICIYHNGYYDMIAIPLWLNDLKLGYKFHLKHASTYEEETVLFASVE